MLKYLFIVSIAFTGCVNEIDETSSSNISGPAQDDSPGHDEQTKGEGNPGTGEGKPLDKSGCMLNNASNFDSSATVPCTSGCVGNNTGENCCCEE